VWYSGPPALLYDVTTWEVWTAGSACVSVVIGYCVSLRRDHHVIYATLLRLSIIIIIIIVIFVVIITLMSGGGRGLRSRGRDVVDQTGSAREVHVT